MKNVELSLQYYKFVYRQNISVALIAAISVALWQVQDLPISHDAVTKMKQVNYMCRKKVVVNGENF